MKKNKTLPQPFGILDDLSISLWTLRRPLEPGELPFLEPRGPPVDACQEAKNAKESRRARAEGGGLLEKVLKLHGDRKMEKNGKAG